MSILATIKTASLQARKERNTKKAALLSTLISEASMVGKNNGNRESTDGEVVAVIKKMIANVNETIDILNKSNQETGQVFDLVEEGNLLYTFLPKQLTTEELSNVISTLVAVNNATSIKDMGKVMKALKEQYEGQYDGSEASKIIKGQLNVSV